MSNKQQRRHGSGAGCTSICPHCEQLGAHFVPPIRGERGFYSCDPDYVLPDGGADANLMDGDAVT